MCMLEGGKSSVLDVIGLEVEQTYLVSMDAIDDFR